MERIKITGASLERSKISEETNPSVCNTTRILTSVTRVILDDLLPVLYNLRRLPTPYVSGTTIKEEDHMSNGVVISLPPTDLSSPRVHSSDSKASRDCMEGDTWT